jgi:hypothetical protein
VRAALLDRTGRLGTYTADWETAERLLGESIAVHETHGDPRYAPRVSGRLARVEGMQGKTEATLPRQEAAFATLEAYEPGPSRSPCIRRNRGVCYRPVA